MPLLMTDFSLRMIILSVPMVLPPFGKKAPVLAFADCERIAVKATAIKLIFFIIVCVFSLLIISFLCSGVP